jgi:hypothetical protein
MPTNLSRPKKFIPQMAKPPHGWGEFGNGRVLELTQISHRENEGKKGCLGYSHCGFSGSSSFSLLPLCDEFTFPLF